MKNIITLIMFATLSLVSSQSMAETVSAVDSTLDGAEAKIATKAEKAGASYQITSANVKNVVYVTAKLKE